MFIKEAYQKRIKKQQEQKIDKNIGKERKVQQIGSAKNQKINYDKQEQYFSKEDVPHKARIAKEVVRNFIDPDILGLKKKEWNTSVSVPKNIEQQQSHERKLTKIKLGLFDQPVPKATQPKEYPGTQTRNDYTNWNVSIEVSKKQLNQNLKKQTHISFQHSKSQQKTLLRNYLNPLIVTKKFNESIRSQKQNEQEIRNAIREQFKFYNPKASQQKTDAVVFRLAYEKNLNKEKNQQIQKFPQFKASLTQTLKSRIKAESRHGGIWQKFSIKKKDEVQQYYAWSCCMNQQQNSPGCITTVIDKNRWNLTSFNNN